MTTCYDDNLVIYHRFKVDFTCSACEEVQHVDGTLNDILCGLREAGWPICPECGDDMDFYVMN